MSNTFYESKFSNMLTKLVITEMANKSGKNAFFKDDEEREVGKGPRRIRALHNGAAKRTGKYDTGKRVQKNTQANGTLHPIQYQFRTPESRHHAAIRNMARDFKRKRLGMKPLAKSQYESRKP